MKKIKNKMQRTLIPVELELIFDSFARSYIHAQYKIELNVGVSYGIDEDIFILKLFKCFFSSLILTDEAKNLVERG